MKNRTQPSNGFIVNRTWTWLGIISLCMIVGISYARINNRFGGDAVSLKQPLYDVQEGPLSIGLSLAGTIQARDKVIIKSELEGQSTILYLIPEGEKVKQGDLLVELDSSSLQDGLVDQSIAVQNAEAAYINARENLAIVESQSQSDIDQAQLAFDFADLDLNKYKDGEYPKLLDERLSGIKLKEEELSQAAETLRWSEILYKEKYLSQTAYQKDELAANRSQIELALAKADLDLLENYEYKRQIEQLTSDLKQAEMALERTNRQANASIVQASAELQAKLSEFERQKGKLEKLNDQISKAKIHAPQDGLVVYATSVRRSWRGNNEPLDEGQQVRERQELIHLPTTASYIAEIKIHESSLEKIQLRLPVVITIEALPGKAHYGHVETIAPLPDAQSVYMNPDLKVYNTQIAINGSGDDLRSGMSCQVEIIIEQFENTTYVPVQAVLRIADQPTVFVADGADIDQRVVVLGPDNNRLVQIKSGLAKGERVLLTPPLSAAEVHDEERPSQLIQIPEMEEPPARPSNGRAARGGQRGMREAGERRQGAESQDGADPSAEESGRRRGRGGAGNRQSMSEEERAAMRQRFQNMTPEERAAMRPGGRDGGSAGGRGRRSEGGGTAEGGAD